MKKVAICLLLVALFSNSAFAQKDIERKSYYIGLDAGLFFPSGTGDDFGYSYKTGSYIGLDFTGYLNNYLGFSFKAARTASSSNKLRYIEPGHSGLTSDDIEFSSSIFAFGVAGRYPATQGLDLVGGFGVTYINNSITRYVDNESAPPTKSYLSGENANYYIDVGLRFMVAPNVALGGIVRYLANGASFFGDTITLSGPSLLFNIGFMF